MSGSPSPCPARSRSASMSAVTASSRLRSLGQPVTRHRRSRRTAATVSTPLISSDMESSSILTDMGSSPHPEGEPREPKKGANAFRLAQTTTATPRVSAGERLPFDHVRPRSTAQNCLTRRGHWFNPRIAHEETPQGPIPGGLRASGMRQAASSPVVPCSAVEAAYRLVDCLQDEVRVLGRTGDRHLTSPVCSYDPKYDLSGW